MSLNVLTRQGKAAKTRLNFWVEGVKKTEFTPPHPKIKQLWGGRGDHPPPAKSKKLHVERRLEFAKGLVSRTEKALIE